MSDFPSPVSIPPGFVADESVDRQIVEVIRSLDYEVLSIAEDSPGISDQQVLARANNLHAVLLTADKDFGELVYRQRQLHYGIVLLRLAGVRTETKASITKAVISAHAGELPMGFCVVTSRSIRIRRFPRTDA